MGSKCEIVCGGLILLAGFALIYFGSIVASAMMANLVTGVMLTIFGVMFVVHATNNCPFCK